MVRSTASKVSLFAIAAFAQNAFAGATNWGGEEVKLGAEYRVQLINSDNGLTAPFTEAQTPAADPTKTTSIDVVAANLTLVGKLSPDVTVDLNWSALGGANWFLVDYQAMSSLMVRVGRDSANLGGWENENDLYDSFADSAYLVGGRPFGVVDFFEVQYDLGTGGKVGLQLFNDVMGNFNTAKKQPAGIIEYRGNFGMVSPLVQVASYDMNHSMAYTLGVNLKVADLDAYLDYTADNRASKDPADPKKELVDAHTSIVADLRYTISQVQYFLKYSMYDVKQDGTDAKMNTTPANATDAVALNDNGSVWAVGARCNYVTAYNPYLAVEGRMGKFADPKNAGKEKSYSDMSVLLGVLGKI